MVTLNSQEQVHFRHVTTGEINVFPSGTEIVTLEECSYQPEEGRTLLKIGVASDNDWVAYVYSDELREV